MKIHLHLALLFAVSLPFHYASACDICSENTPEIGNPDQSFTFNGGAVLTCAEHQALADDGAYDDQCANIQLIVSVNGYCGCRPEGGWPVCSICGDDTPVIGDEQDTFIAYDGRQVTCGELQQEGDAGEIAPQDCLFTQTIISREGYCACRPEGGWPVCKICGLDTPEIGEPNFEFTFKGDSVTCESLGDAGDAGLLGPSDCAFAQSTVSVNRYCGCRPAGGWAECIICGEDTPVIGTPDDPLIYNGQSQTCSSVEAQGLAREISPADCSVLQLNTPRACECRPEQGWPVCSVCGSGDSSSVGDPNAIFMYLDKTITCGEVEERGDSGFITPSDCQNVQASAAIQCGCSSGPTTPAPTSLPGQPTPVPAPNPTAPPNLDNCVESGTYCLCEIPDPEPSADVLCPEALGTRYDVSLLYRNLNVDVTHCQGFNQPPVQSIFVSPRGDGVSNIFITFSNGDPQVNLLDTELPMCSDLGFPPSSAPPLTPTNAPTAMTAPPTPSTPEPTSPPSITTAPPTPSTPEPTGPPSITTAPPTESTPVPTNTITDPPTPEDTSFGLVVSSSVMLAYLLVVAIPL